MNFEFLTAERFWAMVGVIVVSYLRTNNWIEDSLANSLITLGLGFIGIKTLDRTVDTVSGK